MESSSNDNTVDDSLKIRQNVSFKFSKFTPKTLSGNKLSDETQNPEKILSIDNKEIKSSVPKEVKKHLIIEPIHKNVWRKPSKPDDLKNPNESESERSIKEQAVRELLEESAARNSEWEDGDRSKSLLRIPIVIQNKLPEGFETDDKLDVSLRAEDSTLEDYENVPIGEFGTAVLRGLGVNPGDPIGNKNKKLVMPIEAVQRSKGLGLGAERKMAKNFKPKDETNDELKLVKYAYICVVQGNHKGSYGIIEGLDESRVIVKLNNLDQNISIPALYVDVISKKQYQKESKVINKASYEKYKNEEIEKNTDKRHKPRTDEHNNSEYYSEKIEKESHHHSRNSHSSKHKRKHNKEDSNKHHQSSQETTWWVRPLLRVRFIDNTYKKGKYFNQKMVVEDVVSIDNCVCKTEDGKYLEDLQPNMLETVIPRSGSSHVMIVKGKHNSQLGVILSRNKRECTATVQLLSDRSKVFVLEYDSICEYVGDTTMFD